jgi:hypothetical protein
VFWGATAAALGEERKVDEVREKNTNTRGGEGVCVNWHAVLFSARCPGWMVRW